MDITKCSGHKCPQKDKCYRHTAKEGRCQSWFMKVPYNHDKKECENYWECVTQHKK